MRGGLNAIEQTGIRKQPLPVVVVRVRVDRLTDRRGEDVAAVPPELPSIRALPVLFLAMSDEQRAQLGRQPHRATSGA